MNRKILLWSMLMTLGLKSFARDVDQEIVKQYAEMAEIVYRDSLIGARQLQVDTQVFMNAISTKEEPILLAQKYQVIKDTWAIPARFPYGQSEIFRFVNGPIDFEPSDDGEVSILESNQYVSVEGRMNSWPLDEAFIDYVDGDSSSGVINDSSIALTKESLIELNQQGGEKNVSTGYHAIEFLLWGQDRDPMGPGKRSFVDYTTAPNASRRGQYLSLLVDLLVEDLDSVTQQWASNSTNYRKEFEQKNPREVFQMIFTSMIAMAGKELRSERIENALLFEDQEEEHSCFSDKTINDLYANALGLYNLYTGQYRATNLPYLVDGVGIDEKIKTTNADLDDKIKKSMNDLLLKISFFYKMDKTGHFEVGVIDLPFDVAIIENKPMVQAIVDQLDELNDLLKLAALELGLNV